MFSSKHRFSFVLAALAIFYHGSNDVQAANVPDLQHKTRMQKIKEMYAFQGFVYALDNCPDPATLTLDFTNMKRSGARTVITFDFCGQGDDANYYGEVIQAAGAAGINIIPLAWTLFNQGQTFVNTALPKVKAVTQAVIKNPGPVLAVAFGDEPLFDNDAGSPETLAKYINQMKADFKNAGVHGMPVSISDMAYGWQASGNITAVADAVDFFMINSFPYFAQNAQSGGSATSWQDFTSDIAFFESIAKGRPLLVTQTGWPSNKNQWLPNSPQVAVSVASQQAYWDLLNSHCKDFFKAKKIGWMYRSWDDTIEGWGVLDENGKPKWNVHAKTKC